MPKRSKRVSNIQRQLEITQRELRHLSDFEWSYTKRLWRFSFASWIFGISCFFFTVILYDPSLISEVPLAYPILILAIAAPLVIVLLLIGRLDRKVRNLERNRRILLARYEKALIDHASELMEEEH